MNREIDAGVNHFQLSTGAVLAEHGTREGVEYRARVTNPIKRYYSVRQITKEQYHAATRLQNDYLTSSHIHHPITVSFGDMVNHLKNYERKFEINQQYYKAIMAIHKEVVRNTIIRVVLDELPAGRRKPMEYLLEGLDQLVRHYKK